MESTYELKGVLSSTDPYGRLRLVINKTLKATKEKNGSWDLLQKIIPDKANHNKPYITNKEPGTEREGECLISLPGKGGKGSPQEQKHERLLELAKELHGQEVQITVRPKEYSFLSTANHNYNREISGTRLLFINIQPLQNATT